MSETKTYEIPSWNLGRLELRIDALARKAKKLGLPEPTLEVVGERFVPVVDSHGMSTGYKRKVFDVIVTGEGPQIEGWTLVGIINHRTGSDKNIVYRVHGYEDLEIPESYRTAEPICEHCGLTRERVSTFVVLNEDETYLQVGSDCLKDFTGHANPDVIAQFATSTLSAMTEAQEDLIGKERESDYLNLQDFLARVDALIGEFGWTPRSESDFALTTADQALDRRLEAQVGEANDEKAEAVIEWVRETLATKDDLNDYEWNLITSFGDSDYFEQRYAGMIASAVNTYDRYMLKLKMAAATNSKHQGEIGERINRLVTVSKRVELDSAFGVLKITVMQDIEGNVYVWKTTAKKMAEGESYMIRGTVKAHDHYDEIPQTILTRCIIKHEPCGEDDYWWNAGNRFECLACKEAK